MTARPLDPGKRGRLRIFFGFAPAVGKTFAMLKSAQRLRSRGLEVVIGVLAHGGDTAIEALAEGLERLSSTTELDLDLALARRPHVLLVDELAHENASTARHRKRWQDVVELLDAGIDVHTTLDVRHVESLSDIVERITFVREQTVPDAMLERADDLDLVDVSVDQLLARVAEGHGPDEGRVFERGRLLALRELALRCVAEHLDAGVRAYRREHDVAETWAAGERILVAVSAAPGSARLVRAAKRMATGLRAPWIAAYVEVPGRSPLDNDSQRRLEAHLVLAESLGATVTRVTGRSVSEAIVAYARTNNITKIVLGKPTHPRIRDLFRGSVLDEVVRGSADVDVHVISGDTAEPQREGQSVGRSSDRSAEVAQYAGATGLIAIATCITWALAELVNVPDPEIIFLGAVMLAAMFFGRRASLLAAVLGVAAYDFFFVAPRYTLAFDNGRYALTFAMMFGVSVTLGTLTLRLRRHETAARRREEETLVLYELSRDLSALLEVRPIARAAARHASLYTGAPAFVFVDVAHETGTRSPLGVWPTGNSFEDDATEDAVRWVATHGRPAGRGTDTWPSAKYLYVPLQTGSDPVGVLALDLSRDPETDALTFGAARRGFLAAFGRQVAFAIDRSRLIDQTRETALGVKAEQLRSALLASVSHDLRTPLAAITGAATTLRDGDRLEQTARQDLVVMICEEADRLERLVANLLDMTRLDSGTVRLRRDWVPPEELIGTALDRLETRLASHEIVTDVAPDLPLVWVDPMLIGQLLINLLENAAKYTPVVARGGAPGRIRVGASIKRRTLRIDVEDNGPGIPAGDEERIFERFYRGNSPGAPGVGLGLAICRAIASAHGGTITVKNVDGGGARFRVSIPQRHTPPSVLSGG